MTFLWIGELRGRCGRAATCAARPDYIFSQQAQSDLWVYDIFTVCYGGGKSGCLHPSLAPHRRAGSHNAATTAMLDIAAYGSTLTRTFNLYPHNDSSFLLHKVTEGLLTAHLKSNSPPCCGRNDVSPVEGVLLECKYCRCSIDTRL